MRTQQLRRQFKDRVDTPEDLEFNAFLGNGDAVVKADDLGNVNVIDFNGNPFVVHNSRVPLIPRLPVVVGYEGTDRKRRQILRSLNVYSNSPYVDVPNHADSHQWFSYDPIRVSAEQFYPGLALPISGTLTVQYYGTPYYLSGVHHGSNQVIDLSPYVPSSGAVWVTVQIDASGVISFVSSGSVASRDLLEYENIPDPSVDNKSLFAVKMYYGQTEIIKTRLDTDIIDLRFTGLVSGTSSLPPLTGNRVVVTSASGTITTDSEIMYDPTEHVLAIGDWLTPEFVGASNVMYLHGDDASAAYYSVIYSDTLTRAPRFIGMRGGGTKSVPSNAVADMMLSNFSGRGAIGTAWSSNVAEIRILANENIGGANMGGRLEVWTIPNASITTGKILSMETVGITAYEQLFIDGSSDQIQLRVQANATQTTKLQTWELSTGVELASISGAGLWTVRLPSTNNVFFDGGNATAVFANAYNVVFGGGASALLAITTGTYNIAIGRAALRNNLQSGSFNIAIGAFSFTDVSVSTNIGLGYESGFKTTTGGNNVALGYQSLYYNITGADNLAIGSESLKGAVGISISQNVSIGSKSGNVIQSSNNVLIGFQAGALLSSGGGNIFLGSNAGYRQTTLTNRFIVDNSQRASAAEEITNAILYGVMASTPASQTLQINAVTSIYGGLIGNEDGGTLEDFRWESDSYDAIFVDASNNSIMLMSNAAGKVGFFGITAVIQQTELTDELTTITFTAPGTPDYAIQDLAAGGFGFVTKDEGNTVLSVIANLQTRVNELETRLAAYGLLVDAD